MKIRLTCTVNHEPVDVLADDYKTLLEVLREDLGLTGTKHGCELGECGTCTVLVDGVPVLSCLALPVECQGHQIRTVEGMAQGGQLHPLQQAFSELGAAQCGYCTPGQICSAVALLTEYSAGWPSYVTADVAAAPALTDVEIAERMSGNICRCSAYPNIVAAIQDVAGGDRR